MGKYDGILLCSDFDGTLAVHGEVSEENAAAIRYFEENGGLFTMVSGRSAKHFKRFEGIFKPNTYICGYNGALISDVDEKEIIYQSFVRDELKEKHVRICREVKDMEYFVLVYSDGEFAMKMAEMDYDALAEALKRDIYKIVYRVSSSVSDAVKAHIEEIIGDSPYMVTRSGMQLIELQNAEACKGSAARRLADALGARKLVCVGDFENDITMVEAADVGYAVDNACESLKAVADRMTVNVKDHAIAAVIEEIDRI